MSRITQNYVDELKAHNITKEKLKAKELDYKVECDKTNALQIELDKQVNKWNKLQEGAVGYATNEEGHVTMAFPIEPYFETTYPQDIDYAVIKSAAYQRNPFYYKDSQGKMCIDNEQYKKYIGGLL